MSGLRTLVRPMIGTARELEAWTRGAAGYLAGVDRGVRVSYGHLRIPAATELARGGIVKLQGLAREFPDTPYRFNVLYLVSSHLPAGAVTCAKWARRKGARVVINQNGVAYSGWHGPGWERVNAPMRDLLGLADHVFYQSAFCKRSADQFAGPARAEWEVLHNAVDVAAFAPAATRQDRPLTLLLAGTHEAWYRFETAVQTVAELRRRNHEVRLLVAGRLRWSADAARADADARRLIAALGMDQHVELTGPYTQAEAPQVFRRADVLLHTKYNDPCPTVVAEAMACALPVVYSATGGVPELVGDAGEGVRTVESYDRDYPPSAVSLADAAERVLSDRDRYSQRARARAVQHLNLDGWLARHRAVFAGAG